MVADSENIPCDGLDDKEDPLAEADSKLQIIDQEIPIEECTQNNAEHENAEDSNQAIPRDAIKCEVVGIFKNLITRNKFCKSSDD